MGTGMFRTTEHAWIVMLVAMVGIFLLTGTILVQAQVIAETREAVLWCLAVLKS